MVESKDIKERSTAITYLLLAFCIYLPDLFNIASGLFIANAIWIASTSDKHDTFRFSLAMTVLLAIGTYPIIDKLLIHTDIAQEVARGRISTRIQLLLLPLAAMFTSKKAPSLRNLLFAHATGAFCISFMLLIAYIKCLLTEFDGIEHSMVNMKLCFRSMFYMIYHRNYFGLNLVMALIGIYHLYTKEKTKTTTWMLYAGSVLFSLIIYLSGARIILVNLLIVLAYVFFEETRKKSTVLALSIPLIVVIVAISSQDRIQSVIFNILSDESKITSLDPRFQIWGSIFSFIGEVSPMTGMGTEAFYPSLLHAYETRGVEVAAFAEYNAHNQYLEMYLEYGLVGVALILLFIYSLYTAEEKRLSIMILSTVAFNLAFESVFNRFKGICIILGIVLIIERAKNERIDNQGSQPLDLARWKKQMLLAATIVTLAFTVKYSFKDKTQYFGSFQRYLKTTTISTPSGNQTAYIIDNTTTSEPYGETSYTYVILKETKISEEQKMEVALQTYISEDFDGDYVKISIECNNTEACSAFFDLDNKGKWAEKHLTIDNKSGIVRVTLTIIKNNCKDLSNLKGQVIYKSPKITTSNNSKE